MSPPDFTQAVARLLSDRVLRERFRADPESVAVALTNNATDRSLVAGLDSAQLEMQAETLLAKRRHQVAARLPKTWALSESAPGLFDAYAAERPWPRGHRRHEHDSLAFIRWLAEHDRAWQFAEMARLEFQLSSRRVRLRRIHGANTWPGWLLLFRTRSGIRVWQLGGRRRT